jgi:hypothetical protein
MGSVGKEQRTAQEGGSDQAGSDTASLGPKTISIGIGAIVVFVLTALVLSPHKRRGLLDVIDDLGVFAVSLLVTTAFLLVAILLYFVAKKTLWELLQLLIVPLALAGIGFWFTMQQEERQHQIEDRRAQVPRTGVLRSALAASCIVRARRPGFRALLTPDGPCIPPARGATSMPPS